MSGERIGAGSNFILDKVEKAVEEESLGDLVVSVAVQLANLVGGASEEAINGVSFSDFDFVSSPSADIGEKTPRRNVGKLEISVDYDVD